MLQKLPLVETAASSRVRRIRNIKNTNIVARVCCPICKSRLELTEENNYLECKNSQCNAKFPVIDGVPILINESTSIFTISDFVGKKDAVRDTSRKSDYFYRLYHTLLRWSPSISENIKARNNYPKFRKLVITNTAVPKVLIIGSGDLGEGLDAIFNDDSIEFVQTDVQLDSRIDTVCDAHDIPFFDESFDGVIIQAVLEHVCDPYRCVDEIYRVLRPRGLVYAETPFMQHVHLGSYDFTRFTLLGHRRLFRKFEVIDDGAVCGAGMGLAWACRGFLLSFTKSKWARGLTHLFVRLTLFWLKYFDYYLIDKPGTLDAASSLYLLGKKSNQTISDKDLIELYRGGQG